MTLRRKTFWFLAGPVGASFLLLYLFASRIWLNEFEELERKSAVNNLEQSVLKTWEMELEKLKILARDRGCGDEAYSLAEELSPSLVKTNASYAWLQQDKLNLLLCVSASGALSQVKTWLPAGGESGIEFENGIVAALVPGRRFAWKDCLAKPQEGVLMLKQGPLLLASHPVSGSQNNAANRGCIVVGKLFSAEMVENLARSSRLKIRMHRCDDPGLPQWARECVASDLKKGEVLVRTADKHTISTLALSRDLFQKPAVVWQVEEPRLIYRQGLKSVREFVLFLMSVGLAFCGGSWWLLSGGVLKRVAVLGDQVGKIASGSDGIQRVSLSGADELNGLADRINDMLDRSAATQSSLRQFREQFETKVNERTKAMVAANATLAMEITDRLQSEEAQRRSEELLLQSQRIGKVGSWELDLKTGCLAWSAETYRLFGLSASVIKPDRSLFSAMVHPDDRERVRKVIEDAIQNHKTYSIDHRIVLGSGEERHVHEEAETVCDETGATVRVIGTVQDITERKLLEDQLRQAQKMEGVGQLAGGIAHDFNNILTVIQGHIGLMLSNPRIPPEIADSLREAGNAATRAAKLTGQLLAFGRRQVLDVKPIHLDLLLRNLASMLRRLLGEHIILKIESAPGVPPIEADTGMLEQVAVNLAVNARDAMPEGGFLSIETDVVNYTVGMALPQSEIHYGRFVRLKIADTGCGMDEEVQKCMFEPFFTTKEFGKGTGLGLATVYGIVKQHRGWIHVESAVGKGSCFSVHFPVCVRVVGENAPDNPPLPVEGGKETILVVEDEDSVRLLVKMCLKRYGYQVLEARTGPEALAVWEKHREEIVLLLTDLVMPGGLMGTDLAGRLRNDKNTLKVIYSSGYPESVKDSGEQLVEGINFLPKPYVPGKLARVVRDCLLRHK